MERRPPTVFSSTTTRFLRALGLLGLLTLATCYWGSDRSYLAGDDPPPLQYRASSPATHSTGVDRDAEWIVWFTDRVDSTTVNPETVRLTADGAAVEITRRVNLLECSVRVRGVDLLAANQDHRLEVDGLRAVTSGRLNGPVELQLTTGEATSLQGVGSPPTMEVLVDEVFRDRCSSCHDAYRPDAGLDFSSAPAAAYTLIGRESRFRPGRILVVPGDHAQSYLMWKLLALPGTFGEPMPPDGDWPIDRHCLTPDPDLRRIAAWIDSLEPDGSEPGDATEM